MDDFHPLKARGVNVSKKNYLLIAASAMVLVLSACSSATIKQAAESPVKVPEDFQQWHCGVTRVESFERNQQLELYVSQRSIPLSLAKDTHLAEDTMQEGELYLSQTDPITSVRIQDQEAEIVIDGQKLPHCTLASSYPKYVKAQGNEPGWQVIDDGNQVALRLQDGTEEAFTQVTRRYLDGSFLYGVRGQFGLKLTHGLCTDTMTGMPHPYSAVLSREGQQYAGCAGDPQATFSGHEWHVTSLYGQDVTEERVHFTLDQGQINGRAACNLFFGSYELSGEGIRIAPSGSTKMACSQEAMQLEYDFLQALFHVYGLTINADDQLILSTPQGDIVAQRENLY